MIDREIPRRETPRRPPDVEIRTDPSLGLAGVQGVTERGVKFVDAIVRQPMNVVDADRVIVDVDAVPGVERDAVLAGLTVDRDVVDRLVPEGSR